MKKRSFLLLVILLLFAACFSAPLTKEEIRNITTREIQADYKSTINACVMVLQDRSAIIHKIDKDSGLISASIESSVNVGLMSAFFMGTHSKTAHFSLSFVVRPITKDRTLVRINIRNHNRELSLTWGVDEETRNIYDRSVYDSFFRDIAYEARR